MAAIHPLNPLDFLAQWRNENQSIQPIQPLQSTADKVKEYFINFLIVVTVLPLIGVGCVKGAYAFAKRTILQSTHAFSENEIQRMEEETRLFFAQNPRAAVPIPFQLSEHTIRTADGARLSVRKLTHNQAAAETHTIICFNANRELSYNPQNHPLVIAAHREGRVCNFVFFDYRGTGRSRGSFEQANHLILDGDAILQWVLQTTLPEQIRLYGKSLGGGVAVQVKNLYPQIGRVLIDRSFLSLERTVTELLPRALCGCIPAVKYILKKYLLELDSENGIRKSQAHYAILYHVHDQIIRDGASLRHAVPARQSYPLNLAVNIANPDHHNLSLEYYEGCQPFLAWLLRDQAPQEEQPQGPPATPPRRRQRLPPLNVQNPNAYQLAPNEGFTPVSPESPNMPNYVE